MFKKNARIQAWGQIILYLVPYKIGSLLQISLSKLAIGAILRQFSPVLNRDVVKYGGLYNADF